MKIRIAFVIHHRVGSWRIVCQFAKIQLYFFKTNVAGETFDLFNNRYTTFDDFFLIVGEFARFESIKITVGIAKDTFFTRFDANSKIGIVIRFKNIDVVSQSSQTDR